MSDIQAKLRAADIARVLPHRDQAVMVDAVLELLPDESITTAKATSFSESYYRGHFPSLPLMPETVILECVIQSSCLLAYSTEPYDPSKTVVSLVGMTKTKFHRSVTPPAMLEIESRFLGRRSNVWRFDGRVYERDGLVFEGVMALSFRNVESVL